MLEYRNIRQPYSFASFLPRPWSGDSLPWSISLLILYYHYCSTVMTRPIIIPCGHTCDICREWIVEGPMAHHKCQKCRRLLESRESLALNQALKDLLGSLYAKCKMEGCSWHRKTGDFLSRHYPECQFVNEPCPSQNCGGTVTRTNMAFHKGMSPRRPVPCTTCE